MFELSRSAGVPARVYQDHQAIEHYEYRYSLCFAIEIPKDLPARPPPGPARPGPASGSGWAGRDLGRVLPSLARRDLAQPIPCRSHAQAGRTGQAWPGRIDQAGPGRARLGVAVEAGNLFKSGSAIEQLSVNVQHLQLCRDEGVCTEL
jgi:hypothetical protein